MLNIFLAIVLESFTDYQGVDEELLQLSKFQKLSGMWIDVDTRGRLHLPANTVIGLLFKLGPPLGFGLTATFKQLLNQVKGKHENVSYIKDIQLFRNEMILRIANQN